MKIQFLLDENLSPRLKTALLRLDPDINVLRVGDADAPALQTSDPDIIQYLVSRKRLLVTDNRSSIPGHLLDYYNAGGAPHWGIVWVRPETTIGRIAEELHFIWSASTLEEWIDRTEWIPL